MSTNAELELGKRWVEEELRRFGMLDDHGRPTEKFEVFRKILRGRWTKLLLREALEKFEILWRDMNDPYDD